LALLVQIPHPTQAKVKFPSPRKAFHAKFATPQAQEIVNYPGYALGDNVEVLNKLIGA